MPWQRLNPIAASRASNDEAPVGSDHAEDAGRRPMPEPLPRDDVVVAFRTVRSSVEGRVVRISGALDDILSRHDYPEPVARALGEGLALAAMLGAALADGGRLTLELATEGALRRMTVHYEAPGRVRGYVAHDADALRVAVGRGAAQALLGPGHLAITMEPAAGGETYQGIVALDGGTLADAARAYFDQSEQLPTFVRIAVACLMEPASGRAADGRRASPGWRWRAGGLLVQHLEATGAGREAAEDEAGDPHSSDEDPSEEDWRRARMLAETVEDHELVDPALSPERLLLRLFHEEGVRVLAARPVTEFCRCSRERIEGFLTRVRPEDLADLRTEQGTVVVTCEFCGRSYDFEI